MPTLSASQLPKVKGVRSIYLGILSPQEASQTYMAGWRSTPNLSCTFCFCFNFYLLIFREKEKHWYAVPPIYAFIVCFLYVPWLDIKPATLAYRDNALTNWATWPGSFCFSSVQFNRFNMFSESCNQHHNKFSSIFIIWKRNLYILAVTPDYPISPQPYGDD